MRPPLLLALFFGLGCPLGQARELRDLAPGAKAAPVRLEVTLREGKRTRQRTILIVPGRGFAVLRQRGLSRSVVWMLSGEHLWRWDPGQTVAKAPFLTVRPWRTELAPWGQLLSLRELDPGRYPIAHWVMVRYFGSRLLRASWCVKTDTGLAIAPLAFRRNLAATFRRYRPADLRPPVGLQLRWQFEQPGMAWRMLWGQRRSAGRLAVSATQRSGGMLFPRSATLHRLCLSPGKPHERARVQISVVASPLRTGLPRPPALLARGLRFRIPDYLQAAISRTKTDPHLRRQLAALLPAASKTRFTQVTWLARHQQEMEARILALRGATQVGARHAILQDRLKQRSQRTDRFASRDIVVGLMLQNLQSDAYRRLLAVALPQYPQDIALGGLRWSIDTNALRTLRDPELVRSLRATRIRLLAAADSPLRLVRDVLLDISAKGHKAAVRHLAEWNSEPRKSPAARKELIQVVLCSWARRPLQARAASERLATRLRQLNLPDVINETLYLWLGLALPELQPVDRGLLIAKISHALGALDRRWRARLLGLVMLSLGPPERAASWFSGILERYPLLHPQLLGPDRLAWLSHPERVLRALPSDRANNRLLRARLAILSNQPKTAFALLRPMIAGKRPSDAVVTTYSALLLHGAGLALHDARRPSWLPPGNWMGSEMAWALYQQDIARSPHPLLLHDAGILASAIGKPDDPLLDRAIESLLASGPLTGARARLASRWCRARSGRPATHGALRKALRAGHCQPMLPAEADLLLALITHSKQPFDLQRTSWALDEGLGPKADQWRVKAVNAAVRALASGPARALAGRQIAALGEDSPGARQLKAHWAMASGAPRKAQARIARLLADWPDSPQLWAYLMRVQQNNKDWAGLARTLKSASPALGDRQRRDLMVQTISGLLGNGQPERAILLTELFCRRHPQAHLYTSSAPLVGLLQAGKLAAFEKLFLIWDRRRGNLSRDILQIELLSLGNRPFEAYSAIEALAKKAPLRAVNARAQFIEKFGENYPFRWYLRTARFPTPSDDEQAEQSMLLRRLGSSSFGKRRRAASRLTAIGIKAGRALQQGTRSKDLEVRRQCTAILRRLFEQQRKR